MLLVTICYLCLQNIYNFAAGIRHEKGVDLPNSRGDLHFSGGFAQKYGLDKTLHLSYDVDVDK